MRGPDLLASDDMRFLRDCRIVPQRRTAGKAERARQHEDGRHAETAERTGLSTSTGGASDDATSGGGANSGDASSGGASSGGDANSGDASSGGGASSGAHSNPSTRPR